MCTGQKGRGEAEDSREREGASYRAEERERRRTGQKRREKHGTLEKREEGGIQDRSERRRGQRFQASCIPMKAIRAWCGI